MGAIQRAKALIGGLGSWGTSIGILLKNRALVQDIMDNKTADKILLTNPVCDDETRSMSWRESAIIFLGRTMGVKVYRVFKQVLANVNKNMDRLILPARPTRGTVRDAYDGILGGYAGANMPTPQDIAYLTRHGVKVVADSDMATVLLIQQRMNPDVFNSIIQYVPELLASGLWRLMSDSAKQSLTPRDEIVLIQRGREIEGLLRSRGLSLLNLGMEGIHEIIFFPQLIREFKGWLERGIVPEWIKDKRDGETVFQFMVRDAIYKATGNTIGPCSIVLGRAIPLVNLSGMNVEIKFLGPKETDATFEKSRVLLADDIQALRNEEMHRLGIIRGPPAGGNTITILLPYEALEAGKTLQERIGRIALLICFQLEKTQHLINNSFSDESQAHDATLEVFRKGYCEPLDLSYKGRVHSYLTYTTFGEAPRTLLAEMSTSIPLLRALRLTITEGAVPNIRSNPVSGGSPCG